MVTLVGTTSGDTLIGTSGDDFLIGDPGAELGNPAWAPPYLGPRAYNGLHADTLLGGDGNDTLVGGPGDDILDGGPGNDTVILLPDAPFGVEVLLGADVDGQPWGAGPDGRGASDEWLPDGVDWLISIENVVGSMNGDTIVGSDVTNWLFGGQGDDWLSGVAGDDVLLGGDGADTLRGGQGVDWLQGDSGNDLLTGGAGGDFFHIGTDGGIDFATDFNAADGDRIAISSGSSYSVQQTAYGAAVVVDGTALILVGVDASAVSAGWFHFI